MFGLKKALKARLKVQEELLELKDEHISCIEEALGTSREIEEQLRLQLNVVKTSLEVSEVNNMTLELENLKLKLEQEAFEFALKTVSCEFKKVEVHQSPSPSIMDYDSFKTSPLELTPTYHFSIRDFCFTPYDSTIKSYLETLNADSIKKEVRLKLQSRFAQVERERADLQRKVERTYANSYK